MIKHDDNALAQFRGKSVVALCLSLLVAASIAACGSDSTHSSDAAGTAVAAGATVAVPPAANSPPIATPPAANNPPSATPPAANNPPSASPPADPVVATHPDVIKKSIGEWVSCDGISDDTDGVTKAFAAAKHAAFTLVVDCPIRVRIGLDIARSIFIDDGTTVEFTAAGKLSVDNTFFPAFVIANSSDITLSGWDIEYDASLPVNSKVEGYEVAGQAVPGAGPAGAFNDYRITKWLTANRGITFDSSKGYVTSQWTGPTNMCAVFFITGDSSRLTVSDLKIAVPVKSGVSRFVPVVFSMNANFKSNQTINAKTPYEARYFAVPHDLHFSNISLDGTYMGWVGVAQNAVFENIHSYRYGDLEDKNGKNVGGTGKWFAPPHLFYFSGSPSAADTALINKNIQIKNVIDEGLRVGTARDTTRNEPLSGNALSLKIGCVGCLVDHYKSSRPDGFLDVLASQDLTISNVQATYNSAFLNNIYPGWRFPQAPYSGLIFENISLTDAAQSTRHLPIDNAGQASNQDIRIKNVHVDINQWKGTSGQPLPFIAGQGNDVTLNYFINVGASGISRSQSGNVETTLEATPAALQAGADTELTWSSKEANSCTGLGAWSGALSTSGSRTLKMNTPGNFDFTLECRNGSAASTTTVRVSVKQ